MPVSRSVATLVLLTSLAGPAVAQSAFVQAVVDGETVEVPGVDLKGELVTLAPDVPDALLATKVGQQILVAGWPVRPGERADFVLTRRDVYAPGAKIWKVTPPGKVEVPRSPLVFYWGSAALTGDLRLLLTLDPRDDTVRGLAWTPTGLYETRPTPPGWRAAPGRHLVGRQALFLSEEERQVQKNRECSVEGTTPRLPSSIASRLQSLAPKAISSLHTATIAVDTDNELLDLEFEDNETDAADYLADLFAEMNVIYERDLLVRLLQGDTFLRVGDDTDGDKYDDDPYDEVSTGTCGQDNCPVTSAQLSEFADYWMATYGSIARALAMMVSGKQFSDTSASGRARLDGLCEDGSSTVSDGGYSFSQVFKASFTTVADDVMVVGHEIGHNFGSDHTHCYDPPVDECYAGESFRGCFSGTESCPAPKTIKGVADVEGTLMSYCHLSSVSCSSSPVFHPTVTDFLDPLIEEEVNDCIFPDCGDGAIRARKATIPDGDTTTFDFTGDLTGSIADDGELSATVAAGSHFVTESAESGWTLVAIHCDDSDSTVDVGTRTATYEVACGETVACTFVNCQDGVDTEFRVPDQEISTTETFHACDTLTAADVDVTSTGNVTFRAGSAIVLKSGFSVANGASFRAEIAGY